MHAEREANKIVANLLAAFHTSQSKDGVGHTRSPISKLDISILFEQAGLSRVWLRCVALIIVGVASTISVALSVGLGLVIALGMSALAYLYIRMRTSQNLASIDRDLPALLTAVASSVRAGIDPLMALLGAKDFMPKDTVLSHELEALRSRIQQGIDEQAALQSFLVIYEHRDVELFKSCLILSRKHGGSLADSLHRITRVVRQRHSFKRKIRAALAMQRLSAFGIAFCALAMAALQFAVNSHAVKAVFAHSAASKIMYAGCGLIAIGLIWMIRLGGGSRS